jgi:hypothetical protein
LSPLILHSSTLIGVVHIKLTHANAAQDYHVSEALLQQRAPEFFEILQERDDCSTVTEIEDVELETFSLFMKWLTLDNNPDYDIFGPLYTNPSGGYYWTSGMPLVKLYVFACDYHIL